MSENAATINDLEGIKTELIRRAEFVGNYRYGYQVYKMTTPTGYILFRLHKESSFVGYKVHDQGTYVEPISWTIEDAETFLSFVVRQKPLHFVIYSMRKYGQAKLAKPDVLKGIRPVFSVGFGKCKCTCFICGDDLWIKHRDFFSESWQPPSDDIGKGQSYYLQKYFGRKGNEKLPIIIISQTLCCVAKPGFNLKTSSRLFSKKRTMSCLRQL